MGECGSFGKLRSGECGDGGQQSSSHPSPSSLSSLSSLFPLLPPLPIPPSPRPPLPPSLHIISHGSPGTLYLGNTTLELHNLEQYRSQLQKWDIAHLYIYGCQVAAGDAGAEFLQKLHQITQAQIYANPTPRATLHEVAPGTSSKFSPAPCPLHPCSPLPSPPQPNKPTKASSQEICSGPKTWATVPATLALASPWIAVATPTSQAGSLAQLTLTPVQLRQT